MTTEADEILALKMEFEEDFHPDVLSVFRRERALYRESIAGDNISPEVAGIIALWTVPMSSHMLEVGRGFTPILPDATQNDLLVTSVATEMVMLADNQVRNISDTSLTDMRSATTQATALLIEQTGVVTAGALAFSGSKILQNLQAARVSSIEISSTQVAAESARGISAVITAVEKKWVTVGDARVRSAHISANNQKVGVNSPFIVGGEPLRFPGDSGLGASAGNVINCRCSAEYS